MAWLVVLGGALVSGGLLLWMYPIDAADIFDNIMHGRILGVYEANPFQQVAQDFQSDPFYRYVAWRRTISAYGPAWELLAGVTARLAALFSYAVLLKQLIFEPLLLWTRPLPPKSWREFRLGPAVLVIPWLYILLTWWHVRYLRHRTNRKTRLES